MSSHDDAGAGELSKTGTNMDTPVFDETLEALATAGAASTGNVGAGKAIACPNECPSEVGHRLQLAIREPPGGGLTSLAFGVRIRTDHNDPELLIRTALHVLARQLGPSTSIDLVAHDRGPLARIEHGSGSAACS